MKRMCKGKYWDPISIGLQSFATCIIIRMESDEAVDCIACRRIYSFL